MNIIIPKSNEVDQFLVDVRDGYEGRTKNNFKDLTDKVLYLPKTIFSKNDTIPTFEQIKEELEKTREKLITEYLNDLTDKMESINSFYNAEFNYSHIKNFVKAYKNSLKLYDTKYYSINSKKIINSDLFQSFDDLNQDMTVKIKKVPKELGVNQSVMEIADLNFYPILVKELVLR